MIYDIEHGAERARELGSKNGWDDGLRAWEHSATGSNGLRGIS